MSDGQRKYDVRTLRSVWKGSELDHDTEWGLADVGLSREIAIARMIMRAMRFNEDEAVYFLEAILKGADPEEPYRVREEQDEGYLWFCIVREDGQPPVVPDRA